MRGRPRAFDVEQALDQALRTFWRAGYQATSMSDLTEAIGIGRASLYGAFGDKDAVFRRALARYRERYGGRPLLALEEEADVRQAFGRFLFELADFLTDPELPGGCLIANSAAQCTEGPAAREVANCLAESTAQFRRRLQRALNEGQLSPNADIAALADTFCAVMQGMSVMARAGTPRAGLRAVAETALAVLPASATGEPRAERRH